MTATAHSAPVRPAGPSVSPRRAALRDVAVVAPGVLPFGLVVGIAAATTNTGPLAGLLGAALVYGGSAQLTAITVLHLGAGVVTAVLAGAIVNSRLLLYGAALEPRFRGQPLWFRLVGALFIIDQTYLAATDRGFHGRWFRHYWVWMGLALLAVWTSGVTLGIVGGPLLPPLPHLILVGTAVFLALLLPRLVTRTAVVAAGTSGAVALAAAHVVPDLKILAGTLAGLLAALVHDGRSRS